MLRQSSLLNYRIRWVLLYSILFCFLSVSDINIVAIVARTFCPDPHIGDVLIFCIAIQSALDISFEINAVCACADGVVPAVYRCIAQYESFTFGIALCICDPVFNIKGSRIFRRLRLCYIWRLRFGFRFFIWRFCFRRFTFRKLRCCAWRRFFDRRSNLFFSDIYNSRPFCFGRLYFFCWLCRCWLCGGHSRLDCPILTLGRDRLFFFLCQLYRRYGRCCFYWCFCYYRFRYRC